MISSKRDAGSGVPLFSTLTGAIHRRDGFGSECLLPEIAPQEDPEGLINLPCTGAGPDPSSSHKVSAISSVVER